MSAVKIIRSGVAVLALCLMPVLAHAIAITDVTFRVLPGDYQFADAATLLGGNDSLADIDALGGDFAGDPWALLDKTDEASSVFNDVNFVLTADINDKSGSWELSWSGSGLPITMDFIFVTKAANNWGAYLYEAIEFTSDPTSGDGTFEITWTNNGGKIPGLSHASLYGRLAEQIDLPPPPPPPPPPPLPLPGTLLLTGLGLLALRFRLA